MTSAPMPGDSPPSVPPPSDSSRSVERAIAHYAIGEKIRKLRLRKKISLADLGKHTGLSPSMLSQLENGKLAPTLPTLTRVAMVFDVGLDYFFSERAGQRPFAIARAAERLRFPDREGASNPAYVFECLAYSAQEKAIQAYVAEFPPARPASEDHSHDGSELVYVAAGSVAIVYQGAQHVLGPGDSAFFDASEPHSYRCASESTATAVVVSCPPRL